MNNRRIHLGSEKVEQEKEIKLSQRYINREMIFPQTKKKPEVLVNLVQSSLN
jgi:hypothetical protein